MELLWLVLSLIVLDLAALVFAVDTRPGLRHTSRWHDGRRWDGHRRWPDRRRSLTG